MKQWDTFISHASEDKEQVALPLSLALRQRGVRVWLDKFELRIGDSLRQKIDEGLANSRFGVVILSPSFFQNIGRHANWKAFSHLRTRDIATFPFGMK